MSKSYHSGSWRRSWQISGMLPLMAISTLLQKLGTNHIELFVNMEGNAVSIEFDPETYKLRIDARSESRFENSQPDIAKVRDALYHAYYELQNTHPNINKAGLCIETALKEIK